MKVFHHNDNDGKAAAAAVYLFAYNSLYDIKKDDFISVNYNDRIPSADMIEEGEVVYIVDYSFTENTVQILLDISKKANGNVYWYDHHKSSLEVYDDILEKEVCTKAIVDINRSGAMIAYDELVRDRCIESDVMGEVFRLVDDYDRWIHNDPNSLFFNIGSTLVPNGPMDDIWFSNPKPIYEKGKIIKEYNDKKNSRLVKHNGYMIRINGKDCIVMNTPEASSQAFAEYYDEYKFAIRFSFNGTNYEYSIYSELEDIDCAKIARHFNPKGGGHKGAAGFVSDKIVFTDQCIFIV